MADSVQQKQFSSLFDANHSDIWRYVRRRVLTSADADDVAADVFATAWRRAGDLPEPAEQRLWLFGVARNLLLNHRRSLLRQDRLVARLSVVTLRDPVVEIVERDDSLWRALAMLSSDDRDLLLMRAWDQLSVTDIALLLDCSPNAASLRLHKARARLRSALEQIEAPGGHAHPQKDSDPVGDEVSEPTRKEATR